MNPTPASGLLHNDKRIFQSNSKMFAETIDNEDILKLPKISFQGEIIVVHNEKQLKESFPLLQKSSVIGFDTETKPSFRKGLSNGVALLQLSSADVALIIRLKTTGVPGVLKRFFEDEKVIKVGAAIRDDIRSILKIKRFNPKGFIDLQHLAKEMGIESQSVRKLAAIVLNSRVSKNQQLSNWEADRLSDAQLVYAATDAWVCREIYLKLIE